MLEKKRERSAKLSPILEKDIAEILVTNGRAFEPFVRTFSYNGENVTKSHLGTLVGVFEVGERTEESAYIVNFLASVAKKEYFAQGRRGPIESFEAALHKVNIALAELVKHGNVEWLGKLHGALAIIEKNNLHFSATGEAKILLFRHGSFTDISEGLASPESALHPMKTFVEVASGRLEASDCLLLTTPEILQLFTLEELEKNATRLEKRFPQFLKTALINELDMAGLLYLTFSEGTEAPEPSSTKPAQKVSAPSPIENVFSEQAFIAPGKEEGEFQETLETPEEKSEYIDSKTGHIYVQGETPENEDAHPYWESLRLTFEDAWISTQGFFGTRRRLWKKARKQGLILFDRLAEGSRVAARKLWRASRQIFRQKKGEKFVSPEEPAPVLRQNSGAARSFESEPPILDQISGEPAPALLPKKEISSSLRSWLERATPPEEKNERQDAPPSIPSSGFLVILRRLRKRSAKVFKKLLILLKRASNSFLSFSSSFFRRLLEKTQEGYHALPARFRLPATLGGGLLLIFGLWWGIETLREGRANENAPPVIGNIFTPSLIPEGEKNAQAAGTTLLVAERDEEAVRPLFIGTTLYLVTQAGVLNVSDTSFYPLPSGEKAVEAAIMEDLELIFILTESGKLLSWSPITRSYTENNLTLPENANIQDMGAYLTYLYVLDAESDQIYRFPRASGGFSAPVLWLREITPIEETARMAVNETLFLAPAPTTLDAYFQGRKARTLEMPAATLSVAALYTKPGSSRIYALDRDSKRLLAWNTEGSLERQFFGDIFAEATAIAVNAEGTEAFIVVKNQLFSISLTNASAN